MFANAAGPILAVYLLAMGVPKLEFLVTQAWFFFFINPIKVPLHVAFWHTISLESLAISAVGITALSALALLF